jgi:hypothetical protein
MAQQPCGNDTRIVQRQHVPGLQQLDDIREDVVRQLAGLTP